MATVPADRHLAGAHAHDHHHAIGFIRKYIFSMDHKVIGIQFMFTSLLLMVVGGLLALAVRWQIAWPFDVSQPLPGASLISGFFNAATQTTVIPGDFYNMLFTMHATFMIFFVIIPMLVGAFGNVLIPLQIGARDMAFPLLNMLSYWVALAGGVVMIASFFLETNEAVLQFTGTAQGGWTSYPPLSTAAYSPSLGQSLWLLSLLLVGTSSLMGAVNYITTILNLRAPGMTLFRMPLTTWSLFITSILILMSTPVLTTALLMLLFDRHFGTDFFIISDVVRGGAANAGLDSGQPLLYQHLFWFYSHPAVYIMILPAMGMTSDILATFARKPIFGYKPMVFAIGGIAFLGFIVWGHHMFASGMNPILGTTFMASTILIALPSAIKTFNWLGTIWGGQIRFTPAMLFALGFVSMFVIGGLSGIFMATAPVDIYFHDTYFIVGHIHYVLFGGSMFGIFAGIYYWFPKMFGKNMNQPLGLLHFWLTLIAFNLTFFLMHIIGIGGHPRRYATILQYPTLEFLQPLNIAMSIGALMLGMAMIPFVVNTFCSLGRYGNRILLYPLILVALQYTPLEIVTRIWDSSVASAGFGALPVAMAYIAAIFIIFGIIDALLVSVLRLNWDRPLNPAFAVATWVLAVPMFMLPLFVKGDFWEWIGVNSESYVINADDYLMAPMRPLPAAVDASRMEESDVLKIAKGDGAGQAARVPAVSAVLVQYPPLYEATRDEGIDLASSPLGEHITDLDEHNNFVLPVEVLNGLEDELKSAVESAMLSVPAWIAEVQRQDLVPNHTVSRSWKAAATGNFHIITFTNQTMGWVLTVLSGVAGLLLLSLYRRRLAFATPVGSNPWRANSLEWCATSPPWHENFPETPQVYRGPYEFASPATDKDYLPQWEKLPDGVVEPSGH